MRQGQQSRRGRNRGRKPQNSISRNYELSGPDVKIRGTAMHIAEKYSSLARDAMSSGDSVAAENYLQHAEHYNRIILAAQAQNPGMEQPNGMNGSNRFGPSDQFQRDYDGDLDEGDGDDYMPLPPPPQQHRSVPERAPYIPNQPQPYNPNQPQPFIPQNAFPHVQPQLQPAAPVQAVPPYAGDSFPAPEGAPRRRRRRPIGDHPGKPFNGRHSSPGGAVTNGVAPSSDSTPDEGTPS